MRILAVVDETISMGAAQEMWGAVETLRGIDDEVICLVFGQESWVAESMGDIRALSAPATADRAAVIADVVTDQSCSLTVVSADIGARIAAANAAEVMDGEFFSDLVQANTESNGLQLRKLAYGGKATVLIDAPVERTVISFRPKSSHPVSVGRLQPSMSVDAPVAESLDVSWETMPRSDALHLEDARIVISGGRGLGGPDGFSPLRVLAGLLGGEVGASRAAVDAGWIEPQRQVGQTGVTVSPDLYVAVGISGATQHLAGMLHSKHIVSINPDVEAPIHAHADVAVAGNFSAVLEGAINTLKASQLQS